MAKTITKKRLEQFAEALSADDKTTAQTAESYQQYMLKLVEFLDGRALTQPLLDEYKVWLMEEKQFQKRSANTYITAVRKFLKVMEWDSLSICVYPLDRVLDKTKYGKYLTLKEYQRLVVTAFNMDMLQMGMLIQTMCHMSLRLKEGIAMTYEDVVRGYVEVTRQKQPFDESIPSYLRQDLEQFAKRCGIAQGGIFVTGSGRPADRSNLWRELKKLCRYAGLNEDEVSLQKLKKPELDDYYPYYPLPGHCDAARQAV
jgi:site-specific recombinase XerD